MFVIEEDIDGSTLVLLQHNDIVQIFPRIKDRVKFIGQRTKLISNITEQRQSSNSVTGSLFLTEYSPSSFKSLDPLIENNTSSPSLFNDNVELNSDNNQITDSNALNQTNSDDNDYNLMKVRLPPDYEGPNLPMRMQQYIDDNNLAKFLLHTAMRSELLSLFFNDITNSYKLL